MRPSLSKMCKMPLKLSAWVSSLPTEVAICVLNSKCTLKPLAESHLNPLHAQPTCAGSSAANAPNPIVLLANSCLPQTYSFACCFKPCFHHHPFLFGLLGSMKIPRSSLEQSQSKPGHFYPQMLRHSLPTGCQPPLGEAPGAELPTQRGFFCRHQPLQAF